jgi:hypothetical protein
VRRIGLIADVVAIVAALLVRVAPLSAQFIERHYSNGIYPSIDRAVRAITGPLPFTLGDVLFFVAVFFLIRYWIVTLRRAGERRGPVAARVLLRTVAIAAAIFVWFEASWAFNYGRVPLADKIPVHNERTDEDSVGRYADHVTDMLSKLADAAHAEEAHATDETFEAKLVPRFDAITQRLGNVATFAPPHIKPTVFQTTMQLSATNGFTDPWTHEVNVDSSTFFFERPAIYAHEWGHISGFADESEANFISFIACTTSKDPLIAYSGWVLVWFNLPTGVHLTHPMGKTAYDDIMAIRARYTKQVNKQVAHAQVAVYDTYLKSNHVKAGYGSYRLFVRWLTGADFDRDGLPIVKEQTT